MENVNPTAAPAANSPSRPQLKTRKGFVYEPAIGPRLKVLLFVIFGTVAILGATGAYLSAIRFLNWMNQARGRDYTNYFTLGMFMTHEVVGVLIVVPFLFFGITHLATARKRPNRLAVRLGIVLFITGILVLMTGMALIQLPRLPQLPTEAWGRAIVLWLHIVTPILAVWIYVLHRRAGPEIKWKWGGAWGVAVGLFILVMIGMHSQDPRKWYAKGPKEGEKYFEPSKLRTATGNFIPASALMMDNYCLKCHQDIYNSWFHSSHHFSSFNNPPYLFSVRETRKVSKERDGYVRASRWCAGCHDVVPFVSGAFDNPDFDDVKDPSGQAGLTCTVCHAITNVNSPSGNGDYTIEEPQHYPFAYSDNAFLQWLNNQTVKAKPDFHKKTMLKPFHKTAEFCSTCHKVSLPADLNHYKEFLRGQNHYDNFLLSGVSGVAARAFYYPPKAKTNCAECHMPLQSSRDFGSKDSDASGIRKIHSHNFVAANTGLPHLLSLDQSKIPNPVGFKNMIRTHEDFLRGTDPEGKDKKLRIDIFGLKEGGSIDGKLIAPLRPEIPKLKPGATYLVEIIIRTLNVGHVFPQGTADSNEIWVDFQARSGDRVIGRNGALSGPGETGVVDEWSHFINALVLDRNGNRINRRNPQDIFTPLYDHQITPGSAQVVHYKLKVPEDVTGPVEIAVKLRYRKFDHEYMSLVYKEEGKVPQLPIVDICEDKVIFAVEGGKGEVAGQSSPIKPPWQRWNDYGIGCYLEGGVGAKKGERRQAEEAFRQLLKLDVKDAEPHAFLNLARIYFDEGRLGEAVEALNKAQKTEAPAPWWTVAWFNGLVNAQNGHLDRAIEDFEKILEAKNQPVDRNFDFRRDYVVINELGTSYFRRSQQEDKFVDRIPFLMKAVAQYERTLQIEPEDLDAHYGLSQCFTHLGVGTAEVDISKVKPVSDPEGLIEQAKILGDLKASSSSRLNAAAVLGEGIAKFGGLPLKPEKPKLPTLQSLVVLCRPTFEPAGDSEVKTAAAKVLGLLYRQTHAVYKPDDNAKDRAIRIYRETHPAAAAASQAIVIYPANRAGAPGLAEQPKKADGGATTASR